MFEIIHIDNNKLTIYVYLSDKYVEFFIKFNE